MTPCSRTFWHLAVHVRAQQVGSIGVEGQFDPSREQTLNDIA